MQRVPWKRQDWVFAQEILQVLANPCCFWQETRMERRQDDWYRWRQRHKRHQAGLDSPAFRIKRRRLHKVLPRTLSWWRRPVVLDTPQCRLSLHTHWHPLLPETEKRDGCAEKPHPALLQPGVRNRFCRRRCTRLYDDYARCHRLARHSSERISFISAKRLQRKEDFILYFEKSCLPTWKHFQESPQRIRNKMERHQDIYRIRYAVGWKILRRSNEIRSSRQCRG